MATVKLKASGYIEPAHRTEDEAEEDSKTFS